MADIALGRAAAPARLFRLRFPTHHLLIAAVATYLAATALWPLARLFAEAIAPSEGAAWFGVFLQEWQSRSAIRALSNTIETSLLATVLSIVLGTAYAILIALTNIRLKSLMVFAVLLPLLIPSQITALAWIGLLGPSSPILGVLGVAPAPGTTNPLYSQWGIVLVMGVEHAGLVFLAVQALMKRLPRDAVEAARLAGASGPRILRSILLPLALPAILAGAALAFVASIGNFGVPALLGIPGRYTMLTTLIYQRLQGFGPSVLGEVASLALGLTMLAALGLALREGAIKRFGVIIDRGGSAMDPFPLKAWRIPVELVAWAILLAIAVLPLVALVGTALIPASGVPLRMDTATLDNFAFVIAEYASSKRAFLNSFLLAGTAAAASGAVALCLAYLSVMGRNPVARALNLAADAPYAVPGTVLGIAIILVYLPPLPVLGLSLYNTFWIILIAYLARFLVLALRPAASAMEALSPTMDEAARTAGARVGRRLFSIILPNVAPALSAGAILVFMQAFNELTVSALLWSSGWETLGVVIFFLQREGNSVAAAALASVVLTVTLLIALSDNLLSRRLPRGVLPWQA